MSAPRRLLDQWGTGLARLRGDALLDAIGASEGRVVLTELVAGAPPLLAGTANAELAAAFGADLICCNLVDPLGDVTLPGLETVTPRPEGFAALSELLGRPVGLNLEPDIDGVPPPYRVTARRVAAAADDGAAFVIVTANPGRGAAADDLATAVEAVRAAGDDVLCLAGKMHHAGRREPPDPAAVTTLVAAGAHGVLVPLPGTMPGMDAATAAAMVTAAQDGGALAVGAIGTSQEGADAGTIRLLALEAKRLGVDVHHLGDAGFTGIAAPENIYTYGVAIRGIRHTWNRMARNTRATWGGPR